MAGPSRDVPGFDGYVVAARAWASGDPSALDRLDEARRRLTDAQERRWIDLAEWLCKDDPEIVVGLVGLHLDLLSRDVQRAPEGDPKPSPTPRRPALAMGLPSLEATPTEDAWAGRWSARSLRLLQGLLSLPALADREGTRARARFVIGLVLRDAGALDGARQLLLAAAESDEVRAEAWLTTAAIDEKTGRLDRARETLTALVARRSDALEAQLRLAVVETRLASRRPRSVDADALVARLLAVAAADGPEWIAIVAREEAIRWLARADSGAALALAAESRARHPDEPAFVLQQLALLGVADPTAAGLAVELAVPAGRSPSPRAVYNLWPADAEPVRRAFLAEIAAARLPLRKRLDDALDPR